MDFEKIKTLVTATSAFVTAGNLYTKLNLKEKLSESEVNDFLEPIHNDFMKAKQGLENIEMDKVKIQLKTKLESLKAPRFLKDNRETFTKLENHLNEVVNKYNDVCNLCVGVFNESLNIEQLNCNFRIEELGEVPLKLVDYLFHFKKNEEVNELYKDLVELVRNKIPDSELDWIEKNKLHQKIDDAVSNAINRIKAIDISIQSPIAEFVRKYFNDATTNAELKEYQIMLQGYVRSFLEYRNFVYKEVKEIAASIGDYYEKNKPRK